MCSKCIATATLQLICRSLFLTAFQLGRGQRAFGARLLCQQSLDGTQSLYSRREALYVYCAHSRGAITVQSSRSHVTDTVLTVDRGFTIAVLLAYSHVDCIQTTVRQIFQLQFAVRCSRNAARVTTRLGRSSV